MAIEGLDTLHLRAGLPRLINKNDAVGASVEALSRLELIEDHERVYETASADFDILRQSGNTSEVWPWLPKHLCPLPNIIREINDGTFRGSRRYMPNEPVWELWASNTHSNSNPVKSNVDPVYVKETANWPPHLRSAINNPLNPKEPLLHSLNLPFDETHAKDGQSTQQKELVAAKQKYENAHPRFSVVPIDGESMAMIILIKQIMGEPRPLGVGSLRDGTRMRTALYSGQLLVSIVGCKVLKNHDFFFMVADADDGMAKPDIGVGLSIGKPF